MEYEEIVKKLIGNIQPQGCANRDAESLDNLKEMIKLTESLVSNISDVYFRNRGNNAHSVSQHVKLAQDFLYNLNDYTL